MKVPLQNAKLKCHDLYNKKATFSENDHGKNVEVHMKFIRS